MAEEKIVQQEKKGSILAAMMWMFFLSLLLFWLPLIGAIIAGIVGGKAAGGVLPSIVAVFLPAIIIGIILFAFTATLLTLPYVGAIAGFGSFALISFQVGPLLLGAIIGGLMA